MDTRYIKELAIIMNETNLTELELEVSEGKVKLSKACNTNSTNNFDNQNNCGFSNAETELFRDDSLIIKANSEKKQGTFNEEKQANSANFSQNIENENVCSIEAPMIGTFYSAPSPDEDSFVKIGDKVKKGQVVCIIESMKIMNEIESSEDGTIVGIKAEDGDIVEFGQELFTIQ